LGHLAFICIAPPDQAQVACLS